jgi:large subunit ribosomal protein L21
MYAIVEIAGQQFKVEEGKKIFVHRLEAGKEQTVEFDKVLLIEDDGNVIIGEPTIKDAIVEGLILDDKVRGDKVIVFKKKRKKGYRIKNGHRQNLTHIEIISIGDKNAPKKTRVKKAAVKAAEGPVEAKETTEKKSETKKAATKKAVKKGKKTASAEATEKKPVVKKAASKKSSKGKE